MKIGIDARLYHPEGTGISRYIAELLREIKESHSSHEFVIFLNPDMYKQFEPADNMKLIEVDAPYYSIAEQTKFLWDLIREKLDLVHFPHFNVPILYRKPSIVTIHDITISKYPGKKMSSGIRRFAYEITLKNALSVAKKIITVSDNTAKDLQVMYQIPIEKMETIYLGVDSFAPASQEDQLHLLSRFKLEKKYFLYVGAWRDHKNIVCLIKAFEKVRKTHDVQIVICGKPSPYYPEILEAISKSPYRQDIICPGFVTDQDLQSLYSQAIALVNPSLYEGFGVPPLEAMKCGTVALVSNVSSHPEICADGAAYFDPNSDEDIAQSMAKILEDSEYRKQLLLRGQKRVAQFSWKKMSESILQIYSQTLSNVHINS